MTISVCGHKTENWIRRTPIDTQILPVILWLNTIPGVITQWSCEGEMVQTGDFRDKPYVLFQYQNNYHGNELGEIAQTIQDYGTIRFNWSYAFGLRYCITFKDQDNLKQCVQNELGEFVNKPLPEVINWQI